MQRIIYLLIIAVLLGGCLSTPDSQVWSNEWPEQLPLEERVAARPDDHELVEVELGELRLALATWDRYEYAVNAYNYVLARGIQVSKELERAKFNEWLNGFAFGLAGLGFGIFIGGLL